MTSKIAFALSDKGLQTIAQMFNSYQEESTRREWVRTHYATLLEKVKAEQQSLLRYYEMKFCRAAGNLGGILLATARSSGNWERLTLTGGAVRYPGNYQSRPAG